MFVGNVFSKIKNFGKNMNVQLMPHQEQALQRLRDSGGKQLLNLTPGAGKTLTAITYLKEISAKNVLIICPASILDVWVAECEKWEAPHVMRFDGTPAKRTKLLSELTAPRDHNWVVCGYEMFLREHKKLSKLKLDAVVADECHKIKTPTAKVSKAFRVFAQSSSVRILLSGTPLINHIGDMWSQVEAVHPGSLYGNWYAFRNLHAVMPIPGIPMIKGWRNTDIILEKIKPYVFTIDKQSILRSLPPVSTVDVPVVLSPIESASYRQIRDELRLELGNGEEITIANALVKIGRLRQCANGLVHFGGDRSRKLEVLKELLETLGDEHVIVFSMYSQTVEFFAKELGIKYVVTGSTVQRGDTIDAWRNNGGVLIGTNSISTGLNLQEARYVIQIEPAWTKAEEDQRIARAWRTGQKRPVTVYNLLAKDTIDYAIKKLIFKKGISADEVSEYTMAEIKELL